MDRTTAQHHARLLADVARAATIVAPLWPLTSFVAVNPLGGLTHLPFDRATAEARRWLGARTHLSLADHRADHAAGRVTDGDLVRAVLEALPVLATTAPVAVGGRTVDPVELVRLDLVAGPEEPAHPDHVQPRLGEAVAVAIDDHVTTWCAAFTDEAGAPWTMPGRDLGFYAAWRALVGDDRRLRRLVGPAGRAWIAALPERALDALDTSLHALGVVDEHRVDELRTHLGRLPGWAGHARWRDEWAAPDQDGPVLHLVDLLAVRTSVEAAAAHSGIRPVVSAPSGTAGDADTLLDARVAAVLAALGAAVDDPAAPEVRRVLGRVPGPLRSGIWLAAAEGNERDRLLGALSRPGTDAGADDDGERPDVQAVFCIDVRSEGMRRHLEAQGPYETFGFAGFFGVPVRWRPLGSPRAEARCPVLVTPRHEVLEQPIPAADAGRHLTGRRTAGAAGAAFHAAKGGLSSPFTLAESAGWVAGPLAAVRTLAPGRSPGVDVTGAPETAPVLDAGIAGLSVEERTLFAEAILATVGLHRPARLVVLCGHGSATVNNPHASSLDCGACGGAPGGASARVAAAVLNDPDVRAALASRGMAVADDTWFVPAEHDTAADTVTVLDRHTVPSSHHELLARFEADAAGAGAALAEERARRLPGDPRRVRRRGRDWAQVRPEWGLAGNAAFVVGPRSVTAGLDLGCRTFLHSYDAGSDPDGVALETILTAPLVVAQWISSQYYFSTVDPDVFGAGDKTLHNPVGGIGVVLGAGGDLRVGLPAQSVAVGDRREHRPVRLLAVVQAPLERTESIIRRNGVLRELFDGEWLGVAGRADAGEPWSVRAPGGTWSTWFPATALVPQHDLVDAR